MSKKYGKLRYPLMICLGRTLFWGDLAFVSIGKSQGVEVETWTKAIWYYSLESFLFLLFSRVRWVIVCPILTFENILLNYVFTILVQSTALHSFCSFLCVCLIFNGKIQQHDTIHTFTLFTHSHTSYTFLLYLCCIGDNLLVISLVPLSFRIYLPGSDVNNDWAVGFH